MQTLRRRGSLAARVESLELRQLLADTAVIAGGLWNDANGNGTRESTELPLAGRMVYLDANRNGSPDPGERRTLSNADGRYRFVELAAGEYAVRQVLPGGWKQTFPTTAAHVVTLGAGQVAESRHFGSQRIATPTFGAVGGVLFNDLNGDGARQAGEGPLANRVVYIDADNDKVLDPTERKTLSNADGHYKFLELTPGTYTIRQVVPEGWKQTFPLGNGGHVVTVTAGQAVGEKHFGSQRVVTPVVGAIAGVVFNDRNGDGARQGGEEPLASRVVYIDANNNARLDTGERAVRTDAAGKYVLRELAAGTYRVRQVNPDGWRQSFPMGNSAHVVTIGAGTTPAIAERHFGSTRNVLIAGRVFKDLNGNGAADPGEGGIGGWRVYVDANNNGKLDAGERSVLTSPEGRWHIGSLAAGSYKIRLALPASGWQITRPTSGVYSFTLGSGAVTDSAIFGVKPIVTTA
jgi:protocatechuate 3,4-dioxygenase beta subunit